MRYLVLLKSASASAPPPPELMAAIMALGQEATDSGALLDTAGLQPSATGSRVSLVAGQLSVTDGPFTESKELISYAIYDVRSREEATEWTNRFMALHRDMWPGWEGEADVLKLFGPEDFHPPAAASDGS